MTCPVDVPNEGKSSEPSQSEHSTGPVPPSDGQGLTRFEHQLIQRLDTLIEQMNVLITMALDVAESDDQYDEDLTGFDMSGKRIS